MLNDKYVVLKRDDYDKLTTPTKGELISHALNDCWVVRKQDQHAPMSVYSYAHSVQNTIEILQEFAPKQTAAIAQLEKIREAAYSFAVDAQEFQLKRLPD